MQSFFNEWVCLIFPHNNYHQINSSFFSSDFNPMTNNQRPLYRTNTSHRLSEAERFVWEYENTEKERKALIVKRIFTERIICVKKTNIRTPSRERGGCLLYLKVKLQFIDCKLIGIIRIAGQILQLTVHFIFNKLNWSFKKSHKILDKTWSHHWFCATSFLERVINSSLYNSVKQLHVLLFPNLNHVIIL